MLGFLEYVEEVRSYAARELGLRLSGERARKVARLAYAVQASAEGNATVRNRGRSRTLLDPVGEAAVNNIVREQFAALA